MNIEPFFPLLVFVIIGVFAILGWYRRKELQELKAIELQLIAAENNYEYQENGSSYLSRLNQRDLLPGSRCTFKNLLSHQYDGHIIRLFDASYVVSQGKSSKTIYLIGLAIEFEDVLLPRFDLKSAKLLDGLKIFSNKKKIKNERLPKWLQDDFSLFQRRQALPQEVTGFLQGKSALRNHISYSDFALLAGSSKTLVCYYLGSMDSSEQFVQQMMGKRIQIARIIDQEVLGPPDDGLAAEIKLLKQVRATS